MKNQFLVAAAFFLPMLIHAQAPDFSGAYNIVLDYKLDGAITGETYTGTLRLMRGDDNNYSVLLLGDSYPALVSFSGNKAIIGGSNSGSGMVQVWVANINGSKITGVYSNNQFRGDLIATKRTE